MKVDNNIIKSLMSFSKIIEPYNSLIKEQTYYAIKYNTQLGVNIYLN